MSFLPDPLHPALVHFPIALVLASWLLDLLARHPRARSLAPGAVALATLAALGGVVAVLTGEMAGEEAVVPPGAVALLGRHEALGELSMWLLVGLALLRLLAAWHGAPAGWLLASYLLLATVVAGVVSYQGYLGGELVFRHGLGTAPMQRASVR